MMGLEHVEVRDGVLRATSVNADPAFVSPPLELRANRFSRLVVQMRSRAAAGPVQLFWTTMTEPATTELASVSAPTVADGRWHRYVLPVATNPHWGGASRQWLRSGDRQGCGGRNQVDPTRIRPAPGPLSLRERVRVRAFVGQPPSAVLGNSTQPKAAVSQVDSDSGLIPQ